MSSKVDAMRQLFPQPRKSPSAGRSGLSSVVLAMQYPTMNFNPSHDRVHLAYTGIKRWLWVWGALFQRRKFDTERKDRNRTAFDIDNAILHYQLLVLTDIAEVRPNINRYPESSQPEIVRPHGTAQGINLSTISEAKVEGFFHSLSQEPKVRRR